MWSEFQTLGWAIAPIDLGSGELETRPTPADWVKKFIGARALGVL